MGSLVPYTENERERIYQRRQQGKTIAEIAKELGRSEDGVRKWCRRIRDEGVAGLRTRKRGPKAKGTLSSFDEKVVAKALKYKRSNTRWGADRVILELEDDDELAGKSLPSRSRLAQYFKEKCPECLAEYQKKEEKPKAPPTASAVHEIWQLDNQEKIILHNGEVATLCTIREPYGAAIIASQAFSVKTEKRWRKLTWEEVRQVLRTGFTEWGTLPDSVLTDNELVMAGAPCSSFPTKLTLWLVGLGVKHRFIRPRCPTDQPHVERTHRILDNLALSEKNLTDMDALQASLDKERQIYNFRFPSRASDCQRRSPITAHPELLLPRRPYHPELEAILFDIQRVYNFLASFTFVRKVNSTGALSLGHQMYSIGRCFAGKSVLIRCDPDTYQWVFFEVIQDEEQSREIELVRRPIKDIQFETLTGFEIQPVVLSEPIQLTLPCLA